MFAKYIVLPFAIATNSGTAALHLSLLALGVGSGDEVILPSYTSADLLNAINYLGGIPILVDTKKDSCLIDTSSIGGKITDKTKAMIIPHTFGFPVDIPSLSHYNIPIIEDCAQSIGSLLKKKPVGSFGGISIFSFFATKLLTTGQGGMILTNNKKYYHLIQDLVKYNGRRNYKVRYNYPLTDIAASIGIVQLAKYPNFCKRRKEIAQKYQRIVKEKNIFHCPTAGDRDIVPFRFLIGCKNIGQLQKIKMKLMQKGIEAKEPIMPYELLHRLLHQQKNNFPNTEKFAKTMLSLPLYPCLTDKEIVYITNTLGEIL